MCVCVCVCVYTLRLEYDKFYFVGKREDQPLGFCTTSLKHC